MRFSSRSTVLAASALAALAPLAGAATPAHATTAPSTPSATFNDEPFHYAKGDHLTTGTTPSKNRYGTGRPVYLVGDSMAGQLSDALLKNTAYRKMALLPRTRSATSFKLPANTSTPQGLWSSRVFSQIKSDAMLGRRPIVVLAGQSMGTSTEIRRTVAELRKVGAYPSLATNTAMPTNASAIPSCVAKHPDRAANTYCRFTKYLGRSGPNRSAIMYAAKYEGLPLLDVEKYATVGSGPTYAPVQTGSSGRWVQVYRGAGSHLTATYAKEVLYKYTPVLLTA